MNARSVIKAVRSALLTVVLVGLIADIAGELGAWTPWLVQAARRELAPHGLQCTAGRVRIGLVSGVQIDDLVVRDATAAQEVLLLRIRALRARPSLVSLARHGSLLARIRAEKVGVYLPEDLATDAVAPLLRTSQITMRASAEGWHVQDLRGDLAGLPLRLAGEITGLRQAPPVDEAGPIRCWSWSRARLPSPLGEWVETVVNPMRRVVFTEPENRLTGRFRLPLDEPLACQAEMRIRLADAPLAGLPLRSLKADVQVDGAEVRADRINAFLAGGTAFQGSARYSRERQLLSAEASGSVRVERLLAWLGNGTAHAVAEGIVCSPPVDVEFALKDSPLPPRQWQGEFKVSTKALRYRDETVGPAVFEGTFGSARVDFTTLRIDRPKQEEPLATGSLAVEIPHRRWSGEVRINAPVHRLVDTLGWGDRLPKGIQFREGAAADEIQIRSEGSPWALGELSVQGEAVLRSLVIGELDLASVKAGFRLQGNDLALEGILAAIEGSADDGPFLEGQVAFDLEQKTWSANLRGSCETSSLFKAANPMLPEAKDGWGDARGRVSVQLRIEESPLDPLSWTGAAGVAGSDVFAFGRSIHSLDVPIRFSEEALNVDAAIVELRDGVPLRVDARLDRPSLELSGVAKGTISSADLRELFPGPRRTDKLANLNIERMDIRVEADGVSLNKPGWRVTGALSTGPGRLESFSWEEIPSTAFSLEVPPLDQKPLKLVCAVPKVVVGPNSFLRDAEVLVEAGEGISVRVLGYAEASPRLVRAFITVPAIQQTYDAIWRDFGWEEEAPPKVRLKSLHFFNNPTEDRWFLRMEADTEIDALRYRSIVAHDVAGTILVDLPQQIRIKDVVAKTPGGEDTKGHALFKMGRWAACRFHVNGGMDPNAILASVLSGWGDEAPVTFARESSGTLSGTVPFARPEAALLSGALKTAELTVGPVHFTESSGTWAWQDGALDVKAFESDLYGGRFKGEGAYHFGTKSGSLEFDAADVKLQPLVANIKEGKAVEQKGRVHFKKAKLDIYHKGEEEKRVLDGKAKLELTDSQLWKIPVFSQLAKVLRVSLVRRLIELGDISALSADLEFTGNKVILRDFETNGTVISLQGIKPGEYNWKTHSFELLIRGVLLKKTVIVPILTFPFQWLFEAELKGTEAQPEWRIIKVVKEGILGTDEQD